MFRKNTGLIDGRTNSGGLTGLNYESYTFVSPAANGRFYCAGYYNWPAAAAMLTQASPSTTLGTANAMYMGHVGIVASGAGTVDTGSIGISVTGSTWDPDTGTYATSQTENIVTDITALSANEYVESSKFFVGQVTIQFYTSGGSPTTYSLNFNYGFSKYDDRFDSNFEVRSFEMSGRARSNDSNFRVRLFHHYPSGGNWAYSAASFDPINATDAFVDTNDITTENNIASGEEFAFKVKNLGQSISGQNKEGYIIVVDTSVNNSVAFLNVVLGFQDQ